MSDSDYVKVITIQTVKVYCDNKKCRWEGDVMPPFEGSQDALRWLNAPCPKCKTPLITQRDIDMLRKKEWVAEFANIVLNAIFPSSWLKSWCKR